MLDRYNVQHSEIVKAAMKKRDAYIAEKMAATQQDLPNGPRNWLGFLFVW
jgi:hypothetical protein